MRNTRWGWMMALMGYIVAANKWARGSELAWNMHAVISQHSAVFVGGRAPTRYFFLRTCTCTCFPKSVIRQFRGMGMTAKKISSFIFGPSTSRATQSKPPWPGVMPTYVPGFTWSLRSLSTLGYANEGSGMISTLHSGTTSAGSLEILSGLPIVMVSSDQWTFMPPCSLIPFRILSASSPNPHHILHGIPNEGRMQAKAWAAFPPPTMHTFLIKGLMGTLGLSCIAFLAIQSCKYGRAAAG
mmetsp:Transcript_70527/g.117829  ORF Transcript_70527/g.117829 Transcript_70527/m.117829 type:complete len:241 (-) Transcript_70527:116-838(-)